LGVGAGVSMAEMVNYPGERDLVLRIAARAGLDVRPGETMALIRWRTARLLSVCLAMPEGATVYRCQVIDHA
jgi:hypothetical protein